ncbi:nucleoside hydrolase [Actinomycetospora cinnamomea]|uniref:Pyrimidine-specific ribonucleoside hydrolase n=1 Tax=Actinomycetospora cinnamomea TaxID=663609 RepID=A0A2U1FR54_9PSEU|nr:nucleoside hydrolase [Actinomycetospora cinnamomea]PVZ14671.1 pyrimidine-specific ribonucleoside hydrolase [Actinomycetospora cinnamomea]
MAVGLIVDTDPGVDDAFALAVAAHSAELDLRAVTTVFGNVDLPTTTDNAGRVLGLLGRRDVPIGRGAGRPLIHPTTRRAVDVHGDDGLGGTAEAFGPVGDGPAGRAIDVATRVLETADEPVVLAAIGPLTNVALLLATRPDLADRIDRLVVMGGALGEGGNITMGAEFNVWSDPEAARRVLVEERVPTTLVPLDLTHAVTVDEPWLDALGRSGPVGAALAGTRAPYLAHYGRRLGAPRIAIHDAVALLEAAVPGTLATTPLALEVDTSLGPARGTVLADRRPDADPGAHRVDVALPAGTGLDAVREALFHRLTGDRAG